MVTNKMQQKIVDYFCFAGTYPFGRPGEFELNDLLSEIDTVGIAYSYVTDVGSIFYKESSKANLSFIEKCSAHPNCLSPLPVIDLSVNTFRKDIPLYARMGIKGVRIAPNYHGYQLERNVYEELLGILGELGLMLFVAKQIEEVRFQSESLGVKALGAEEVNLLAGMDTDVTIVLNNFAANEIPAALSDFPDNVFFDVSAFDKSFLSMERFIDTHGVGNLVFGSHTPFLCCGAVLYNLKNSFVDNSNVSKILKGINS